MERITVLVENKNFLDYQKYHDASIYYILKKNRMGPSVTKGLLNMSRKWQSIFLFLRKKLLKFI